jgi:hypothetical protein
MSAEAWVKLDQLPKEYATGVGNVKILYRVHPTLKSGYEMVIGTADNKPRFKIWINGNKWGEVVALQPLGTGEWYHLVATYDGASLRLYVNGSLVSSTGWSQGIGSGYDTDIKIGGATVDTTKPSNSIRGSLDEIRLYDRALTAAEVIARSIIPTGKKSPRC